jgi:hypothetical protein
LAHHPQGRAVNIFAQQRPKETVILEVGHRFFLISGKAFATIAPLENPVNQLMMTGDNGPKSIMWERSLRRVSSFCPILH